MNNLPRKFQLSIRSLTQKVTTFCNKMHACIALHKTIHIKYKHETKHASGLPYLWSIPWNTSNQKYVCIPVPKANHLNEFPILSFLLLKHWQISPYSNSKDQRSHTITMVYHYDVINWSLKLNPMRTQIACLYSICYTQILTLQILQSATRETSNAWMKLLCAISFRYKTYCICSIQTWYKNNGFTCSTTRSSKWAYKYETR